MPIKKIPQKILHLTGFAILVAVSWLQILVPVYQAYLVFTAN